MSQRHGLSGHRYYAVLQRLTRKEAAKAAAQQEVAFPGASGEAAAPTAGQPAAVEEEEEVRLSCGCYKRIAVLEPAGAYTAGSAVAGIAACGLNVSLPALQGVNAYDISDPVDILPELRTFDDEVANTAKWSVRRDILTKLKTLAGGHA
jgi:hypothetical protein